MEETVLKIHIAFVSIKIIQAKRDSRIIPGFHMQRNWEDMSLDFQQHFMDLANGWDSINLDFVIFIDPLLQITFFSLANGHTRVLAVSVDRCLHKVAIQIHLYERQLSDL